MAALRPPKVLNHWIASILSFDDEERTSNRPGQLGLLSGKLELLLFQRLRDFHPLG